MLQTFPVFLSNNGDKVPAGIRLLEPTAGTKQIERGSLYAVVDLRGSHPEREHLVEQMLSELQKGYYSLKGKQSAVLLDSIQGAMNLLDDFNRHNPNNPLAGGLICAGIVNDRLMLANAGPLFAMLSMGQSVEMFPLETDARSSGSVNNSVLRRELNIGDAIFLGATTWEEAISLRILAATVAHIDVGNRFDAASGILEQMRSTPPPGMFLVFGEEGATALTGRPSSPTISNRRTSFSGLPTSVGTQSPVSPRPPIEPERAVDETKLRSEPLRPLPNLDDEENEAGSPTQATPAQSGTTTLASVPTETPLGRLGRLLKGVLPDAQPPASERERSATNSAALSSLSTEEVAAQKSSTKKSAAQYETFVPPPPARGGRARIFILAALAIALATAAIVAGTVWQKGANQRAEAEVQLGIALARIGSAQTAIDTGNKENALALLTEARAAISARQALLVATDPQSEDLTRQITQVEQQVLQVQRLYGLIEPLVQFPTGARPTRVLVVDQDIYILDEGRQVVERYRLDQGKTTVPDQAPQTLIHQGDTIDGAQVGPLVDFTWQLPVPGFDDKANLFILDANNNVFRFNPRVDGAGLINLGGEDKVIKTARQLKTFNGRLYVADVGTNQLYRFQPGEYETAPEAWFPDGNQYDLTGLHTMRIDGDIWMLFDDGKILRFFNGQQAPFALDNRLGLAQQPVDLTVSEEDTGRLYLADRAQSRVIVYDKTGAYISQLAAPEGNPLQNLSGLFIEDVTNTLYLLTDNYLFQHDLPE